MFLSVEAIRIGTDLAHHVVRVVDIVRADVEREIFTGGAVLDKLPFGVAFMDAPAKLFCLIEQIVDVHVVPQLTEVDFDDGHLLAEARAVFAPSVSRLVCVLVVIAEGEAFDASGLRNLAHHVSIAGAVALEATHPLFDALLNVVGLFLRNDHNAVHPAVHFGFAPNGYRVFTHIVCPFLHIRIDADIISN